MANIVGILAGIATLIFGYIQFIHPWPIHQSVEKYTFRATEFLGNPKLTRFSEGDTLRLTQKVTLSWEGVTSCDKNERIRDEYQRAFHAWRNRTLSAVEGFQYASSNYVDGPTSASFEREPWPDNSRSCKGSGSIDCWIEFIRF